MVLSCLAMSTLEEHYLHMCTPAIDDYATPRRLTVCGRDCLLVIVLKPSNFQSPNTLILLIDGASLAAHSFISHLAVGDFPEEWRRLYRTLAYDHDVRECNPIYQSPLSYRMRVDGILGSEVLHHVISTYIFA